ncbi:hypothetical protein [Brevibacillus porteri]|uniref:hypothetical protein n=1 Tax=Brevibacillus porteri TaxID=2126350 RepID=UPI003D1C1058
MLAKRFSAIPFILLLFLVLSFPIPTLAKESSFQNPYYVFSWDEAGNVRITDLAKKVGKVRHASEYRANDERTNSFSLVVGYQPKLMPRFMSQPFGFLATRMDRAC